jgi:hypothetical protein
MAEFCSFCGYNEIDYHTKIKENLDIINEEIRKHGFCKMYGGICEGCCSTGIVINKDLTIEIDGQHYVGRLNPHTFNVEVDEESDIYKRIYKGKKEMMDKELQTLKREMLAVKHIAYGLYMVGDDPIMMSKHECVSFEDFDISLDEFKKYNFKAWDLYMQKNHLEEL